jgi:hypothetical protein
VALAGEDTFTFTTPDWLADRLVIDRRLPGVRVRQVASEKIAGGRLRWTVTLDEPRDTELLLSAQAVLPLPETPRIAAPLVTFERIVADENGRRPQPLENQQQHLVLINQSAQQLDRDAPAGGVEVVSPGDLPIRIGAEISDQAAEILAVRGAGGDVGWKLLPLSALKALPAAVNVSRTTLVVARDGSWRAQCDYRVSNRSRQFLAVRLPPKSRVLSLFVAGQPARPIDRRRPNDSDVRLVPLPKTAAGDLSAEIRLVLAGQFDRPLPKGVQVLRTEFDLPAVQVLSQAEDPEFGAPVAATEWTVVLPDDMAAQPIDDPGRTNVASSSEGIEQLIAQYQELLSLASFASEGRLQNNLRQVSRAEYNLKELARNVQNYSDRPDSLSGDERQTRQLAELQQKWEAAQQERANRVQDGQTAAIAPFGNTLSQQRVQQEILSNNSIVFSPGRTSDDTDELKLELADSRPVPSRQSGKAGVKGAEAGRPARSRAALKDETAAQSIDVNANAAVEQAPIRRGMPNERTDAAKKSQPQKFGQPPPQTAPPESDVDSDDVLQFAEERYGTVPVLDRNERPERRMAGVPILGKAPRKSRLMAQNRGIVVGPGQNAGPDRANKGAIDGTAGSVRPGGLSLEIAIPQAGQKLTFSKPGGGAKLALGLRPQTSIETGVGLIWFVVWGLVALGLIAALGRADAMAVLSRQTALGLSLIGLAWYFLLPVSIVGFGLFVVGLLALGWQHRRAR